MIREDFEKGVADYDLARMSESLAVESEAGPLEGQEEGVQVASTAGIASGVGRKILKGMFGEERGKLYGRNAGDLVANKPQPPASVGIDEVSETLGRYQRDKSTTRPPMLPDGEQEAFPGLETAQSVDELSMLVEQAGKTEVPDSRSWREVKARTDTVSKVLNELRPIAEGRQGGALTDVQLHGVSRIVATAYDDVETIIAKIAAGTETPEDILRLANAKDTYEVMSGYLKGQGSEIGRALNSLKMTGEALKGKDLAAYEKMTSGEAGTKFVKYIREFGDAINKRMERGDTIGKAMAFANEALRGDVIRIAVEFWKNNQLSGIKTHVVNNASVGAHLMYENLVVRPLASGIGTVRRGIVGGEQPIRPDELLAPLYSSYAGVRGYMGLFWDNIAHGKQQFDAMDKVEDSLALSDAIKNSDAPNFLKKTADFATSASFKLLTASDEANRGIAFTQELYALASRRASNEGLRGEAHVVRMNELLDEPPVAMYDRAMTHAAQMTFTDVEQKGWIASTSKALRVMVGEIPPLQFIIPYINTPSNLLRVGMETSPLAPLSKRLREDIAAGGVKGDIAMAKMVGGMGMGIMYWQLVESGVLQGSGPDDYKAQEMLKADGWQPWSVNIDGKAYGMERMDPFTKGAKFTESLAAFMGEMDKAKYAATDEDKENAFARGMLYMVDAMMEDQWLEQASSFIKVLEGAESFDKYIARTGAGFVPYHALLKSVKEFEQAGRPQLSQDSIESSILNMMQDQIRGNMPDLPFMDPHWVRVKRNWDGTVHMPQQSDFAAGASPWGPTKLIADRATKELFENGVTPQEPSSILKFSGQEISLLQLDESGRLYDDYLQAVGAMRREVVTKYLDSSAYKRAKIKYKGGPGAVIEGALNDAMSKGRTAGRGMFLKNFLAVLKKRPEIQASLNLRFGVDMVAVITEAIRNPELSEVKGASPLTPARGEFEYPIPEMK